MSPLALIRGGGELGTAVGHAFAKAGLRVLVFDQPLPGALRLGVAFASAAVHGSVVVQGVVAVACADPEAVHAAWAAGRVAVWTRPPVELGDVDPTVVVDARMRSLSMPIARLDEAPVVIGIGPGLVAGRDVHLVVESNRGPRLGAVIRSGSAEEHTGIPGDVLGHREERILRAPCSGPFVRACELGDLVEVGDVVGTVEGQPVRAKLRGMVRGLKLTGVPVGAGHKVGDVDPRRDRALLHAMSDKAIAVGRGALAALREAGLLESEHEQADRRNVACI